MAPLDLFWFAEHAGAILCDSEMIQPSVAGKPEVYLAWLDEYM